MSWITLLNISDPLQILSLSVIAVLVYFIHGYLASLFFSPLSSFPGPRLAGATILWQAFHRKRGTLSKVLRDIHIRTGHPVLRIGPNHLSFWDSEAYNEIYISRKFRKEQTYDIAFRIAPSLGSPFTPSDQTPWSTRRRRLQTMFSRQSIASLEPLFHEQLAIFSTQLTSMARNNETVNLMNAFRCLTTDILAIFTFGKTAGCLEAKGFMSPSLKSIHAWAENVHFRVYFPSLVRALEFLPSFLKRKSLEPSYSELQRLARNALKDYHDRDRHHDYPILFSGMLNSKPSISDDELVGDALVFTATGADSAGLVVSVGSTYIATNPLIQDKLYVELRTAYPERTDILRARWSDLEKLPYLSACVYESLRIAVPIPGELPRVVPEPGWEFKGFGIPAGTVVSSSAISVNFNTSVFPEPDIFRPERWLDESGKLSKSLPGWFSLVSFGKGPRSCLGNTMAMAELYISMAAFFRLYRAEIVNQAQRVELVDLFIAWPVGEWGNVRLRCNED